MNKTTSSLIAFICLGTALAGCTPSSSRAPQTSVAPPVPVVNSYPPRDPSLNPPVAAPAPVKGAKAAPAGYPVAAAPVPAPTAAPTAAQARGSVAAANSSTAARANAALPVSASNPSTAIVDINRSNVAVLGVNSPRPTTFENSCNPAPYLFESKGGYSAVRVKDCRNDQLVYLPASAQAQIDVYTAQCAQACGAK